MTLKNLLILFIKMCCSKVSILKKQNKMCFSWFFFKVIISCLINRTTDIKNKNIFCTFVSINCKEVTILTKTDQINSIYGTNAGACFP